MPNPIKYSLSSETQSLKKGNFWIGTNDVSKGPTTLTDYWNGITPPSGGYVIYGNKNENGPSIYVADDDDMFVYITNRLNNFGLTSATQALAWYATQSDSIVINRDYEEITTDGLIFNMDAGFIPSYPKSGNTFYDLSVNDNNGTLTNGPTYNSNDGGVITLDGVNDRIEFSGVSLPTGSSYSTSIWYYQTLSTAGALFGNSSINKAGGTRIEWAESISADYIKVDNSINKIYAAGPFAVYNGNSDYTSLIRLNTDGSIDTSFDCSVGFNYAAEIVETDSNGKVYVGGLFTSYKGVARNRFVRLNSDGSLDNSFNIGTGFNGIVYNLKFDSDGKIYVVGAFTAYNGVTKRGIVKLNTDGSIDNTFDVGDGFRLSVGASTGVAVYALNIDNNGKIYVGGDFTVYRGTTVNRICRINTDGTLDTDFVVAGTGFNSTVRDIAVDSNNDIYVGGLFTNYNGTTNNYLSKLTSSGDIDPTFTNTFGFRTGTSISSTSVFQVKIDTSGKICVVGDFTTWDGSVTNANRMVRLNTDGSVDSSFSMTLGPSSNVYCLDFDSNGDWYIGGAFTTYKGVSRSRISKVLASNANVDTTFLPGTGFSQGLFRVRYVYVYATTIYTTLSIYSGPYSSNYVRRDLQAPYFLNKWINFTMTYDPSNRNLRAYIDGNLFTNTTLATGLLDDKLDVNRIGMDQGTYYLGANISSCLIYNRAISATEVLDNYNAQKTRFGL